MEDHAFRVTKGKDPMHRCHIKASVNDALGLGHERVRQDIQHFFLVLTQDDPLLHTDIEYSHHPVARCACKEAPI